MPLSNLLDNVVGALSPDIGSGSTATFIQGESLLVPLGDYVLCAERPVQELGVFTSGPQGFSYMATSLVLGSSTGAIILGGALALGHLMPQGLQTHHMLRIAAPVPGVFVTNEVFGADTTPVRSMEAKNYLKPYINAFLSEAEFDDLEIGVESALSRNIRNLIEEHGTLAIEALSETFRVRLVSDEVMGVVLRQLGRVRHRASHIVRRNLLIGLLHSNSVRVRYAAATGLAELDDPDAIRALTAALAREPYDRPREHLVLVLDQLRDTQRCLSTL